MLVQVIGIHFQCTLDVSAELIQKLLRYYRRRCLGLSALIALPRALKPHIKDRRRAVLMPSPRTCTERAMCAHQTKCTHPPLPVQVLCARHFISPALEMDADGNRLPEPHSL